MDIAASIQKVTEKIILRALKSLKKEFNLENLCLAGGVALNCVANGKILNEKGYKIARRTVAKYREQLNIPVARLRKEI